MCVEPDAFDVGCCAGWDVAPKCAYEVCVHALFADGGGTVLLDDVIMDF